MEIRDTTPSMKGPAEWFTGDVWIDAIARPTDDAAANVSAVHFHPGARTAWHSHSTGRRCGSPTATASSKPAANPSSPSDRATSIGPPQPNGTGAAPPTNTP
jgi:hypothetical protein